MSPHSLLNKRIIVGITGGIAAYKSAELTRLLIKRGAEVRVVMTDAAQEFIQPLTLQALSGNAVYTNLLDESAEQGMGHIELARWADLIVVAPATADFIARLNAGLANDLLTTLCLATHAPVALTPAMNEKMWHNPLTQRNVDQLKMGLPTCRLYGPASGDQACGDVGYGRMIEPLEIVERVAEDFNESHRLSGKKVVITAGPTQESIDPVRFLSNHSSGKMGFALAEIAASMGANVHLITGPVALETPANVARVDVTSAVSMLDAALSLVSDSDIFIATAAVADYRPATRTEQKLKKDGRNNGMTLELVENPDIVATIARHEQRPTTVIAFAAETEQVESYARNKLIKKQVDAVVANDVSRSDIGFGSEQNQILWVTENSTEPYGPSSKREVAKFIFQQLAQLDTNSLDTNNDA